MKKAIIFKSKARRLTAMMVAILALLVSHSVIAQSLINYLPEGAKTIMTDKQKHYYEKAMDSPFAIQAQLATINFGQLDQNTISFNYDGIPYVTHKDLRRKGVPSSTRISWIGDLEAWNGKVHIVYNEAKKTLVGMIEAESTVFLIRPLGEGLHAIIGWDMVQEENCQVPDGRDFEYRGDNAATPDMTFGNEDIIINSQESNGARVTGECNVRVLCPYTDDVDAAVADILSDINNMVNIANTGYINSESAPGGAISMRIELAAAYEVTYNETGTTMNDDLGCITNTGDGCLDDIHTQRALWDADQVALLTDDGTGLAWVSTDYEDQFSVTGSGNFYAHTFQHELGHNAECTHAINQSSQPGSAPYAGYAEPTDGCFRTVLAYGEACGSTGSCPRQNIFSDDDSGQWNCGSTDYTPGTSNNRNQDRLNLSGPIIVAHNTVSTSATYTGDYNWSARESVHFAAGDHVAYSSSSNNFDLFSGSEGTFRASNSVTLGEGFWARNGSDFTAYTESCATLSRLAYDSDENDSNDPEAFNGQLGLELFPNPFSDNTTLQLQLPYDAPVSLIILDQLGRTIETAYNNSILSSGTHTYKLDGDGLSGGIYHAVLTVGSKRMVKKFVKTY
jgi:hypothetical protein